MTMPKQAPDTPTREIILARAIDLFYERGYHGTAVRQIAKASGISVATLFHHFDRKMSILQEIILGSNEDLTERTEAAGHGLSNPVTALSAAVRTHVIFQCAQQKTSFIGNSELRSLEPDLKLRAIAIRDALQSRFDKTLQDGVDTGLFRTSHVKAVSRAITTMITAIAIWYNPNGLYSPDEIAEQYVNFALRLADVVEELPAIRSSGDQSIDYRMNHTLQVMDAKRNFVK